LKQTEIVEKIKKKSLKLSWTTPHYKLYIISITIDDHHIKMLILLHRKFHQIHTPIGRVVCCCGSWVELSRVELLAMACDHHSSHWGQWMLIGSTHSDRRLHKKPDLMQNFNNHFQFLYVAKRVRKISSTINVFILYTFFVDGSKVYYFLFTLHYLKIDFDSTLHLLYYINMIMSFSIQCSLSSSN
jgi:hypothetical protein